MEEECRGGIAGGGFVVDLIRFFDLSYLQISQNFPKFLE
ncbi:hypothetical protein AB406_0214 [Riemerella anatipestifer]|uniref:Uncharacterized protein n=1 Tax=Riemerella anatipestifer TaxID=34085 RepID=A0A1S7DPY4_RIEAN|nr:hypothetical protein AB406_0208 [Riemerella anatipestifer]AQY21178.1 hypothetical protein AB406_0214 [Riemerella anatipestifer]